MNDIGDHLAQLRDVLRIGWGAKVPRKDLLLEEDVNLTDTAFFNFLATLPFKTNELVSVALGDRDTTQLIVYQVICVGN